MDFTGLKMSAARTNYWFILVYLLSVKEVYSEIDCQIEDDDGEVIGCSNDNTTVTLSLQRKLLSGYRNAKTLSMTSCYIGAIDVNAFVDLRLLERLDLSNNYVDNVTAGIFDALTELEELSLNNNYINDVPVDLFKYNVKLRKLDLGSNYLYWFYYGTFDNMVNLTSLDLSYNRVVGEYWNPDVFVKNVNLYNLKLSGNNMTEVAFNFLSPFNTLISLVLRSCSFVVFPSFLMTSNVKTVIILNLRYNNIERIERNNFGNFEILSMLDLSFNEIEYIAENAFRTLKKLTLLNLSNNHLVTIPNRIFSNMNKLILLDLSRNKIILFQDDLLRITRLKYLNLSHNKLTYLQRNFCQQQKSLGVKLKRFGFDHNPWQCACLKDLLSEVKQLSIKYNSRSFDGNQPVCVTTSEFICKRQESLNKFYTDLYESTYTNSSEPEDNVWSLENNIDNSNIDLQLEGVQ